MREREFLRGEGARLRGRFADAFLSQSQRERFEKFVQEHLIEERQQK
ncbi:MAG: hypothetical protein L0216_15115 [Planctomycetales bacterium]|nr:hypothetical protein [Planctomycetales bacterium]